MTPDDVRQRINSYFVQNWVGVCRAEGHATWLQHKGSDQFYVASADLVTWYVVDSHKEVSFGNGWWGCLERKEGWLGGKDDQRVAGPFNTMESAMAAARVIALSEEVYDP